MTCAILLKFIWSPIFFSLQTFPIAFQYTLFTRVIYILPARQFCYTLTAQFAYPCVCEWCDTLKVNLVSNMFPSLFRMVFDGHCVEESKKSKRIFRCVNHLLQCKITAVTH